MNSIHCVEVCDLRMNLTGCEDVWVQATLGDKSTLVIGSVYRHPHPNFLEFSKTFNKNFLKLKAKKRFVLLGDLNIDYGRYLSDPRVKIFADQITSLGCEQLTDFPTRVCSTRQSILDHVYINGNMMNAVTTSAVITHPLSDHFPIVVQLKCKINRKDEFRPLIRTIKPHKIEKIVEDLNIHLFDANPQKFEDLINCLSNVVNKHFPLTKLSRKQFNFAKKTWMTQEILKSIKHQNNLYKKCQKSGSINDFQTYKSFRNKLPKHPSSTEISKSKNTSTTWKVINSLVRKNRQNSTSS